ncbi:MAG TPA: methylmalonyl-CoA epimerase [Longimicrobiales bacterium]
MKQLPLDHVAIAVASIEEALPTFELLTEAGGSPRERVESQGVDVVFVGTGIGRLELLEPISPDSPVARHLEKRGPGLHHLAYRVRDLEATLARLAAAGVRLIDERPRPGAHGRLVAFLHPRSTGGVLIELVQE